MSCPDQTEKSVTRGKEREARKIGQSAPLHHVNTRSGVVQGKPQQYVTEQWLTFLFSEFSSRPIWVERRQTSMERRGLVRDYDWHDESGSVDYDLDALSDADCPISHACTLPVVFLRVRFSGLRRFYAKAPM